MNNVAANTKTLRAALSGLNVRVRQGVGSYRGCVHVDMKYGSDRTQRIAAHAGLVAVGAVATWGQRPKSVADIFGDSPHHFDSVGIVAFVGAV